MDLTILPDPASLPSLEDLSPEDLARGLSTCRIGDAVVSFRYTPQGESPEELLALFLEAGL